MRAWVCVLMLAAPAFAESKWDWSQDVSYQENHDPSVVWLSDGRRLKVSYAAVPWKTVAGWSKGRALLLAYRPESGVVLVDAESGGVLPVLRGLEKNPIELLTEQCVKENPSTMGAVECYGKGTERWDQELNRAYQALLGALDDEGKKAATKAQQEWVRFRDAQFAAIASVNNRQGTVWRIVSAEQRMKVVREQAERLNDQLDPL